MSEKPSIEERARETTESVARLLLDRPNMASALVVESYRYILAALQAQHEQAIEEACKAVCFWCREGKRPIVTGWHAKTGGRFANFGRRGTPGSTRRSGSGRRRP